MQETTDANKLSAYPTPGSFAFAMYLSGLSYRDTRPLALLGALGRVAKSPGDIATITLAKLAPLMGTTLDRPHWARAVLFCHATQCIAETREPDGWGILDDLRAVTDEELAALRRDEGVDISNAFERFTEGTVQ